MRGWSIGGIATLFVLSGVSHFVVPHTFERIVPSWVPDAHAAVFWSGVAELAGAVGLLIPATRVAAAWGLILLLAAVFPANVQMFLNARADGSGATAQIVLAVRLVLQPLLMRWVWTSAGRRQHAAAFGS